MIIENKGAISNIETKNPLFKDLEQYHFDRREMELVFDIEFENWLCKYINCYSNCFYIGRNEDEYYIMHLPSGTIVNWYKHMGRANTCNKDLTIEDLKEFKRLLLDDFGYLEVENNAI